MECKELFIFENGQPLTTPPPQVSFWAFRLTVSSWQNALPPALATDERRGVWDLTFGP